MLGVLALCCPGHQSTLFNAGAGYRPVGSPRRTTEPPRLEVSPSPSPEGLTHRMAEMTGRDESSFGWLELDLESSPYDPPLTQADASGLTARLLLALGLPRTPVRTTMRVLSPTPASPRAEATEHATAPERPSCSGTTLSFVSNRSIATLVRASKKALRKAERVGDTQGVLKEVR